jgi:hypothetical protein
MSTMNGQANPMGEVHIPDGGMAGVSLYSNSAPVVTVPMGDYMGDDMGQEPAPAPRPVALPPPPAFSVGSALKSPGVLIPAAIGAAIGWFTAKDEDTTAKAKCAAAVGAGVGAAALVGAWLSHK